jgi:phage baseplate assembly protein gpV
VAFKRAVRYDFIAVLGLTHAAIQKGVISVSDRAGAGGNMRVSRRKVVLWAAVQGCLVAAPAFGAIDASWVNPVSDSWTSTTAWSIAPVFPNIDQPNLGDFYNAFITAGGGVGYTITLDTDITLSKLTVNSSVATLVQDTGTLRTLDGGFNLAAGTFRMQDGVLYSDDPMTVAGTFVWNGGTLSGFGSVDLSPSAVLSVGSGATHMLSRIVNNSGMINVNPATIVLNNGTINNQAGGVMNLSSKSHFTRGGGSNLLSNSGVINILNSSSSTTFISVPFQNAGTVNLTGGTLQFNDGSTTHLAGSTFIGTGTVDLGTSSTHTLAGKLTLNTTNAVLGGGTINGAGDLQINDLFYWNGGTMSGSGITRIAHGAAIE